MEHEAIEQQNVTPPWKALTSSHQQVHSAYTNFKNGAIQQILGQTLQILYSVVKFLCTANKVGAKYCLAWQHQSTISVS
jgi:hypothetical protein